MASEGWAVVIRRVHRIFQGGTVAGLSEGQLLDRFVAGRDPVAFEALMARHGPMVLGVCRSILDDPRDVEDAFQATFLVLVRKAGGLRDRDLVGPWLHGVARKVSLRARSNASRRGVRERTGTDHPDLALAAEFDPDLRQLQALVRDEVDRLPIHERAAVVHCYLEGLTHEEAADRLGWPVGTVKGRLARARDRLRDRLNRRGVAVPVGVVASALARTASAVVPAELIASTTLAAGRLAAGKTLAAGIVSAHALSLAEGVIRTMLLTKIKLAAAAVAATCVLASPGVVAYQLGGGVGPSPTKPQAPVALAGPASPFTVQFTPIGGASPTTPSQIAATALNSLAQLEAGGAKPDTDAYYLWSKRLVDAHLAEAGDRRGERIAAIQAYVERLRWKSAGAGDRFRNGQATAIDVLDATYRHEEASRWLAQAQAEPNQPAGNPPDPPQAPPTQPGGFAGGFGGRGGALDRPVGGGFDGGFGGGGATDAGPPARLYRRPAREKPSHADEARNKAILDKLDSLVPMKFGPETPLSQVVQHIKAATREPDGKPIPVYVDPVGLQDADKTMASTVALELEGVPLRTSLRLLLRQLFLTYEVDDGMLIITDIEDRDQPAATLIGEPTPADKARDEAILAELEKEIPMHFPNPTPLGGVIDQIQRSTKGPYGKPIPIYVDPLGLQDADKTIDSPVTIDLEGVPLRTTLRLLLGQIGLRYEVRGGLIVIDVARAEPEPNTAGAAKMGGQGGFR